MPNASVNNATIAKPGLLTSIRTLNRRSCSRVSMTFSSKKDQRAGQPADVSAKSELTVIPAESTTRYPQFVGSSVHSRARPFQNLYDFGTPGDDLFLSGFDGNGGPLAVAFGLFGRDGQCRLAIVVFQVGIGAVRQQH